MARKSGKSKSNKPVKAAKKKIKPVKKPVKKPAKKPVVKKKKSKEKKPAILKKVIVKTKKEKKVKKIKEPKKIVIIPQEFRMNIRCRRCFSVDGYIAGEKTCHNCKEEIYEIDKI